MKENLLFYTRNQDAYNEAGHKALRAQFSWAGEGRFAALEDRIAASPGCVLDLSKKFTRNTLACDLGLSSSELEAFLTFLSDPNECNLLIQIEPNQFTTPRIQETYSVTMKNREASRDRKNKKSGIDVQEDAPEIDEESENASNSESSKKFGELPESSPNFYKLPESSGELSKKQNKTTTNKTTLDETILDNNNYIVVVVADLKNHLEKQNCYQLHFNDDTLQMFMEFCQEKQLDISYIDYLIEIMKKNEKVNKKSILHPGRYFEKIFTDSNLVADFLKASKNPKKQPRAAPPDVCPYCKTKVVPWRKEKDSNKLIIVHCDECRIKIIYDPTQNSWIPEEKRATITDENPLDILENFKEKVAK